MRDFIQFAFWESFPVFNVADSFVTVGAFMLVVVLIVMLVKEGKKNQKEFERRAKGYQLTIKSNRIRSTLPSTSIL